MKALVRGFITAPVFFGDDTVFASVLTAAGLTPEKAAEVIAISGDKVKDFKPDDYVNDIRSTMRTTFLNDNAFLSEIKPEALPDTLKRTLEAGQYGKFMNEAKDYIAKTIGVDLSDLTEAEAKSLKTVLQKGFEKYGAKVNSPEDLKKLQADLLKLSKEKEEVETNSKTALENALKASTENTGKLIQKLVTQTELSAMNLKVKPSLVADTLLTQIQSKYVLVSDGVNISVKQKANPTLDVIEGGKALTFQDALKTAAKENDLIDLKMEKNEPEETVTVSVDGGTAALPSYIKNRIDANIKKEPK